METARMLSRVFLAAHPADGARILEGVPAAESAAVLESTPPDVAGAVLERMAWTSAAACFTRLSGGQARAILGALPLETAAGLLRRLEAQAREQVLESGPADLSAPLRRLLRYPEGTAGALMDPLALALPHDVPVGEAMVRVRRSPRHVLYYLYVVDRAQTLVGVLTLRELMLAAPKAVLGAVGHSHVARLSARADRAAILGHPGWREFHALPVVDADDTFVGAIRYGTFRRLQEETAQRHPAHGTLPTVLALAELCVGGWAGLLVALAPVVGPRPPRSEQAGEGHHAA